VSRACVSRVLAYQTTNKSEKDIYNHIYMYRGEQRAVPTVVSKKICDQQKR
jgi:hypothetical protein